MKHLLVSFMVSLAPLTAAAEDLRYREVIVSDVNSGWCLRMSGNNMDMRVNYGASSDDSGIVYKEIYSFEKFHNEVVAFVDEHPDRVLAKGDPQICITLVPADQPEPDPDGVMPNNTKRCNATELWNSLFAKLLPVTHTPFYRRMNQLLKAHSPFIPVEGRNDFASIQIPRFVNGTREEVVDRMLMNLTKEERVALGHPAEYPVNTDKKGNKRKTNPSRKTVGDGREKK